MNELKIEKKNFEASIRNIDSMSKENKKMPELQKFKEKGGPMQFFKHKVSGEEMNEFANQVQDNLMLLNNKTNQFYNQFVEVYKAFDSLNKDYITAIVHTFNQAIEATKKAEDAQRDINQTIDMLKKAVQKLSEFNAKVNSELSRIDADNWKENALKHQEELDEIDSKANEIMSTVNSYKDQYNSLVEELTIYKKEKQKYNFQLKLCWILTGSMFLFMIIFLIIAL